MATSVPNSGRSLWQQETNPPISLHGMHLATRDIPLGGCSREAAQPPSTLGVRSQPDVHYGNRVGEAAQGLLLLSQPYAHSQSPEATAPEQMNLRLPLIRNIPSPPSTRPASNTPVFRQSSEIPAQINTPDTEDSDHMRPRKRACTRRRKSHTSWTSELNQPLPQRFLSNVVLWFEDLAGGATINNSCGTFEQMASGLRMCPDAATVLSQLETEYLKQKGTDHPNGRSKHQAIRARVFVGLACAYEHNIRGSMLKQRKLHHAAFGPEGKGFSFLNLGKSQAQQLSRGVDVNMASQVFDMCQQDGRLPDLSESSQRRDRYEQTAEAEKAFPPEVRKRLYNELCRCYAKFNVPPHLRLVITDEDLQQRGHM